MSRKKERPGDTLRNARAPKQPEVTPEEKEMLDKLSVLSGELTASLNAMADDLEKQMIAEGRDPGELERMQREVLGPAYHERDPLTRPKREAQVSLPDLAAVELFRAVCDKYGFEHYRYYRQRYTTVMIEATADSVREIVYPEYVALQAELDAATGAKLEELVRQVRATSTRS